MTKFYTRIREWFFRRGNTEKFLIISMIFLSFVLAVYKSAPFSSVDEDLIGRWIWAFHKDPFPVNQYPPMFLYLHFFLSLVYKAVFVLTGIVRTGGDFVNSGAGYDFMISAGRYISAVSGSLMIWFIFRTGREFYNRTAGFAAALLISFNGLFILHSHIFKSDILVSMLLSISLFFLFRFMEGEGNRGLFMSAFFFGLAFAAKYNIVVFATVLFFAALLKREVRGLVKKAGIITAGSVSGFLISSPNWLVHPLGNLKKLVEVYNFEKGDVYIQDLSPLTIYRSFVSDIRDQFGTILFVILVLGIIFSLVVRRDRKTILLSVFVIIYILFFGFTGFYGRRFLLPLYPAIVLIIGKTLFVDLPDIFRPGRNVKRTTAGIVLSLMVIAAVFNASDTLRRFNLLSIETKSASAVKYREAHNLKDRRFVFGSQYMTPRQEGDVRFFQDFSIKPHSRRRGIPDMIQTSAVSVKAHEPVHTGSQPGFINIDEYHLFHGIEREKLQDWDNDILFFYRAAPDLRRIIPEQKKIRLPVMHYLNRADAFFPSGRYEKDPGFVVSLYGRSALMVSSRMKIRAFEMSIFWLRPVPALRIRVNGNEKRIARTTADTGVRRIHMSDFRERSFHFDHVYFIEVFPAGTFSPGKFPVYYTLINPVFEEDNSDTYRELKITERMADIPGLFSVEERPGWIKEVYRKTSVDLSLYEHIQKEYLLKRTGGGCSETEEIVLPLTEGDYIITTSVRNQHGEFPSEGSVLAYQLFSPGAKSDGYFEIKRTGRSDHYLKIPSGSGIVFFRMDYRKIRSGDLVVDEISIRPDLKKFFSRTE